MLVSRAIPKAAIWSWYIAETDTAEYDKRIAIAVKNTSRDATYK